MSEFLKKRLDHINAGRPIPEKKKYYIPKQSAKKKAQIAVDKQARINNGGATELEKWYTRIMKKEKPICWETGEAISTTDFGWHGSIGHILPKEIFQSVALHPLNYVIVKMWGGTHDKTHRWDTFSKMKVWKEAVRRFILIEPDIAPEERKFIPPILLNEIKDPFK